MSSHKEFIAGKKTKEQILTEFLNNFEGTEGNKDGKITMEEFFDYYTDFSMTIASDDYFAAMIESAWMITESETTPAFKSQIDGVEATLKSKLKSITKKADLLLIKKIFGEFDRSKSGALTIDEFSGMLAKLGISIERKYLVSLFNKIDVMKTGVIEFGQFFQFVSGVPYKG